ncbi:MAG: putative repeat protein (TIGR01451 family) [Myxococcota bacterium]|jgi:uncharacterized repeat protein (TIGR01451 family)
MNSIRMLLVTSLVAFTPSMAFAAPTIDNDAGEWFDDYVDNLGVDLASTDADTQASNITYDPFGRLITVADPRPDPALPNQFATTPISPASFDAWGSVYLNYSAADSADIVLRFVGASGTVYDLGPVGPSDDPVWDAQVSLAVVPASETQGQIVAQLTTRDVGGVIIRPTVQGLRATWSPRSIVRVTQELLDPSVCSREDLVYRLRVSVSLVEAKNLVIWAPIATPSANPFGQDNTPLYGAATDGGLLLSATAAPLTIGDITIPPGSVYWQLGNRPPGSTFIVSYTARSPQGTLNGTTYTTIVSGQADNADLAVTVPTVGTISSGALPFLRKSTSGTFRIFNEDHAIAGDAISYNLTLGNYDFGISTTKCGESFFNAYAIDDVSAYFPAAGPLLADPPGINTISNGGQFHPGPDPLCVNGTGAACDGGFVVPPLSVYWDLGHLAVGQRMTLTYRLTLANGTGDDPAGPLVDEQEIDTVARMGSAFEGNERTDDNTVVIGIDNAPGGSYGTGDLIRGSSQITGGANDHRLLSVNYGEPVSFLYAIRNQGASRIDENVIITKVAAGTTFTSAFIGADVNATIRYATAGEANDDSDPPDFDTDNNVFGSAWSTTAPANAGDVQWVAFSIPQLASVYFPEDGVPNTAIGQVAVRIDDPADACPETTVSARGNYYLYSVIPVGGGAPPTFDGGLQYTDTEPIQVIPLVPNLSEVIISDSPQTVLGPGPLTYVVNVPNRQPRGVETDTALDVSVRLTLPTASVNGVETPIPFQGIDAGGGTADLSGLPAIITVTYPTIAPSTTRQIRVNFDTPNGLVDGSTVRLSAQVTGHDDVCGTFSGSDTEVTAIRVEPSLSTTKSVNLTVVNLGDPVEFTLDYSNTGDGVATATWLVDRITDGFDFESATGPSSGGIVWFSSAEAPILPGSLRDDFNFDQAVIVNSGLFSPGIDQGDGTFLSPFGADTTYVAFQLDDPSLSPPQVPTGEVDRVKFIVRVADADTGDTLGNEALVLSSELLGAISNQVQVTVSANPSIRVSRSCPGVATSNEIVTYTVDYFNDASNLDESVILDELLPDEVSFLDATHVWNAATNGAYNAIDVTGEIEGSTVRFNVTDAIGGPLRSLEGGTFTIRVQVRSDVPTGTTTTLAGLAFADNGAINTPVTAFSSCDLLVANADVTIAITVDQPTPVPGDGLTYTLVASNPGAHFADDVSVTSTLPSGVTYIPGSTRLTSAGWQLTANAEPAAIGGALIWSVSSDNALTSTTSGVPGYLPGEQGPIAITFRVTVDSGVAPDTTLENCATISTVTVEDPVFPNEDCVSVRTPLPDPYVEKRAPALARPGDRLSYRILYGNASRQPSGQVLVVDTLFDGPTPDGAVDLTYLTHTVSRGETVYFASSAPAGPIPAFDPADPSAGGWTLDAGSLASVTHIGFLSDPLAGGAGPYSVYVDVELRSPVDGALPQPGSTIVNTATVLMVGPNQSEDDDDTNNVSVAETQTPAVDISLTKACDPEGGFPGTRPGEPITFTLELANTGTVPAHGLAIVDPLGPGFELIDTSASIVTVTDAQGGPSAPIGLDGESVDFNVEWSVVDGVYTIGSRGAEGEPTYYRRVGLAPGDRVVLSINAEVTGDVPSETSLTNTGQATTDYAVGFQPGDPEEEVLGNNTASCSVVVYRPDPLVVKTVEDEDGGQGPVEVGERVTYTINYDNIGGAVADRALLEDYLPDGTAYVVGSFAGLPDGATLRFDDGSGTFDYAPDGATGDVDEAVTAVRIDWGDTPLRAPTNAIFEQISGLQFEDGTFVGTKVDEERDAVTIGGGVSSMPAYLSPVFPGDDEGMVIEWGRIVVGTFVPPESEGSVTITVLDAESGNPVPGFIAMTPDETGVIDLSAIDSADYARLQLRADFVGGGIRCDGDATGLTLLESATPYQRAGRVQLQQPGGRRLAGSLDNGNARVPAVWSGDAGAEFADVLDSLGPMVGRIGMQFAEDGTYVVTLKVGAEWAHEAVLFTPGDDGVWQPTALATEENTQLIHDGVFIKAIRNGVAVGEIRELDYDFDDTDDGDARPFVAIKEADGTWSEATFPTLDATNYTEMSLRFVNDDRAIIGECRGELGLTVCIFEPEADTWVQVYDSGAKLPAYTNIDLADMLPGGGAIGSMSQTAIYFTKASGSWAAVVPTIGDGQQLRLGYNTSVLGSGHYRTTVSSTYYILVPTPGVDQLEVVPFEVGTDTSDLITKAAADGTLFGVRDDRATIWRRDGDGPYAPTDLGEDFTFSEIRNANSSGLARGWVGRPYTGQCSINTSRLLFEPSDALCSDCGTIQASCSNDLPYCSCSSDSQCGGRRSNAGRCIEGTCHERLGVAWVPDAAEATGFRRVDLEGARATYNEDAEENEGWSWEDTDYPGLVTEDGRIVGVKDRMSMPHICETRWDEWKQPLPVYWEPAGETGTAPMHVLPTETVHRAAVYGANADSVLVGTSFAVDGSGRPTVWNPSAGAPGGWSPSLIPIPSLEAIQMSQGYSRVGGDEVFAFPLYVPDAAALHIEDDGTAIGYVEVISMWPNGELWQREWAKFATIFRPTPEGYVATVLPANRRNYHHGLDLLPSGVVYGTEESDFEYPNANGDFESRLYWLPREDGTYVEAHNDPISPFVAYPTALRHNSNGLLYGVGTAETGALPIVLIPDPSVSEGARLAVLPDNNAFASEVLDGNASDVFVGLIRVNKAPTAVAWVPDGPDSWAVVTLGTGVASFIDDNGRIVGSDGASVVIWEPNDSDTWTAFTLPTPEGVSIRDRRDLYKAGFVMGDDFRTAWEKVDDAWRVVPLPVPGEGDFRLISAVNAPALGGTVYVGQDNLPDDEYDYTQTRAIAWNPDGEGGYVAVDLTPEGKFNSAVTEYPFYSQAANGLISIYTNDFVYHDYEVDESNTRYLSERFAMLADPGSATGWTPIALEFPTGKARNELKPQPAVPGLWTLESWGRNITPGVIGCSASPGAFLEDWRVIYRTDQAPSLSFQVAVGDVCQTSVTNTATISTVTAEVTSANNSSSATFSVATSDVRVSLAVDKGVAAFEDVLTYTMTVTNDGPNAANGVVATSSPAAGTDGTAQTYPVGTLNAGESQVFTYTAEVTEVANGVALVANADVITTSIDCNLGNNSGSATTTTGNLPNVYVGVTAPAVVRVNEPFTYTITYGNDGNAPASNVVLTDILPAGVTLVPADQPISFTYDNVDAGATGTEQITVVVTDCALIGSQLVDNAAITASADTNGNDNAAQVTTAVAAPDATLVLGVTGDRGTGESDDEVTFTVHFSNTGSNAVLSAVVAVPFPAGATLAAGTITGNGQVEGDALVWRFPMIPAGASGAVAFAVTLDGTAPAIVAASATGDGICPTQADIPAITTAETPGVHIVKTADQPVVCGEGEISWSLLVTNTGDEAVAGVVVTDTLPSGVTYVADSLTGVGGADTGAPVLVWNVGTLAAGAGITLTYATTRPADAGRLLTNDASVEIGGEVARTASRAAVRVHCGSTLIANKTMGLGCAQPGDPMDVLVEVTNQSQQAATNVVITDYVPEALEFAGTEGEATYSLSARRVQLDVPTMGPGETVVLAYQVTVADTADAGGLLVAQAAAAYDQGVPVVSNVVAAVVLRCDDLNACTADLCEAATGCINPPVADATECTDGDLCTQADTCVAGVCTGMAPVECTALDVCHTPGTCNPETGLCDDPNADDGSRCDDGDVCTTVDGCVSGSCVGAVPSDCDDGDVCTTDLCDSVEGCFTEAADDGIVCDDDDLCSTSSACLAGSCVAVDAADCDDGNVCTLDRCDAELGCVPQPVPNGLFCSDSDLCTSNDLCQDGVCIGSARDCPEADACRFPGECNSATGVCDYAVRPGDKPVRIGLTDLGTLGGESSIAYDVNDASVVVGSAMTEAGDNHAFRWQGDTMVDLTPEADDAVAVQVNATNIVAGVRADGDVRRVFVAQADASATSLWAVTGPLLDPAHVFGPNATGAVAGNGQDIAGAAAAFFSANGSDVSEIAPPEGASGVTVAALADDGAVAGHFTTSGGDAHGFVWQAASGLTDIGTLGGATSTLLAVNANGIAVGSSDLTGDTERHAVVWSQAGGLVDLGTLCAADGVTCGAASEALFLNAEGSVLGLSDNADGEARAFIWDAATGMVELDALGGGVTTAVALSTMGASVGIFTTAQGDRYSVAWTGIEEGGGGQSIATAGAVSSAPVAINGAGQVAGTMTLASGATHAYFWDAERGDSEDLGNLGGLGSQALALNNFGRVAGAAEVTVGTSHAFISDEPQTACIVCETDTIAPTIVCPVVSGVAECVDGGADIALGSPSVSDACGQPVDVTSNTPARYDVGTTVVSFTATDSEGNDASCGTVVEVVDTVAPTILCPEAITVVADDNVCGAQVAVTANAIDACDGTDLSLIGAEQVFPLGTTEVRLTAIDGAGNASSCTTTVTVTDPRPLMLTCSKSVTFEAPPNLCGFETVLTAEVVDVCSARLEVEANQSQFDIGDTVVDFEATREDEVANCQTVVTVLDVTDPRVVCGTPEITTVIPAVYTANSTDACGTTLSIGEPVCVVVDEAGVETEVAEGCAVNVTGPNVDIRTVPGDAADVRWVVEATDPSGNVTEVTCATTVSLVDINPIEPDLTGITATGGGGCQGGGSLPGQLLGWLALLLGGLLVQRRRGRAAAVSVGE